MTTSFYKFTFFCLYLFFFNETDIMTNIDLMDGERVENTGPVHRRASTGQQWASMEEMPKNRTKDGNKDYKQFRRASLSSQEVDEKEAYRKTPTGISKEKVSPDMTALLAGNAELGDLMAKLQTDLQDIESKAKEGIPGKPKSDETT